MQNDFKSIEIVFPEAKKFDIDSAIQKIMNAQFPQEIEQIIREYENLSLYRKQYVFKWMWALLMSRNPGFTLSCVPDNIIGKLAVLKLTLCLWICILDDIADREKNSRFLEKLIYYTFEHLNLPVENNFPAREKTIILFSRKLMKTCLSRLSQFKNWNLFRDIFLYDISQIVNSFKFSLLINTNKWVNNLVENMIYSAHNMMLFAFTGIDIIGSDSFNFSDLPILREIFHYSQKMVRIGNWISTWEREIQENDFSSGVFSYLLSNNFINPSDLEKVTSTEIYQLINKYHVDKYFIDKWYEYRNHVLSLAPRVNSVDVFKFVEGLEYTMMFHLLSRGMK